jgi:uncharacterized phage protein (TIGR01671 family)
MREIEFRGKRIDNGEWAYGWLVRNLKGKDCIIITAPNVDIYKCIPVQKNTIGQYIETPDKNNIKIFEGDIVRATYKKGDVYNEKANIIFYSNGWCIDMSDYYPLCKEGWCVHINDEIEMEIIGNIHTKRSQNEIN